MFTALMLSKTAREFWRTFSVLRIPSLCLSQDATSKKKARRSWSYWLLNFGSTVACAPLTDNDLTGAVCNHSTADVLKGTAQRKRKADDDAKGDIMQATNKKRKKGDK